MEIVIILATLLGGAAAVWFFWDKVRDFFRGRPEEEQKSSRPSAESILCLVGDSSPTDWNYYDPDTKYYFKTDVELTINRHPVERKNQFPEAWDHNFPDRSAYAVKFTVYYIRIRGQQYNR